VGKQRLLFAAQKAVEEGEQITAFGRECGLADSESSMPQMIEPAI
jgi:hypothetical protein